MSKVGGLPGVVESTYSSKGIPPVLVGVGFDTLVIQSPGLWGVYWYGGNEGYPEQGFSVSGLVWMVESGPVQGSGLVCPPLARILFWF